MAVKKQRRTYKPQALMTERIEVRCSVEEKDAIYAAALTAQMPVTQFIREAVMATINQKKGANHG